MMTTGQRFCARSKNLTALRKKIVSSNYRESQSLETWEDTAYSISSMTIQRQVPPTLTVDVTMLSSYQPFIRQMLCEASAGLVVTKPTCIADYSRLMGGVDLSDQLGK